MRGTQSVPKVGFSQLVGILVAAIIGRKRVLIGGPPQVGKSAAVMVAAERVAEVLGACDVETTHLTMMSPAHLNGLGSPDGKGGAVFAAFPFLDKLKKATVRTVWFADELGQCTPAVRSAFCPFLLDGRANGHVLSKEVVVIAATNRAEDKAASTPIEEQVKSRFDSIVELIPDPAAWLEWGHGAGMHGDVLAYITMEPEALCQWNGGTRDLTVVAGYRGWESVSEWLHLSDAGHLPLESLTPCIQGAIGELAANAFLAWRSCKDDMPTPLAALADPDGVTLPARKSVTWAFAAALLRVALRDPDSYGSAFWALTHRIGSELGNEFAQFMSTMATRSDSDMSNQPGYVRVQQLLN